MLKNLYASAKRNKKGFTLIEILLVIGIISILAAVVIIAINPARQFSQARNAQRFSNVNTILNAVHQYAIENNGVIPSAISSTTATEICKTGGFCSSLTDLSVLTLNERYVVSMPVDPLCPTGCFSSSSVGYTIIQSANGRVTVSAPLAENGATISVTR